MDSNGVLVAEGREHQLRHLLSVGRDSANEISLRSRTVSRRHAQLTFVHGRWYVEDMGSANGTFVNGERLSFGAAFPLRHGDRIAVGSAKLVFSWPAEREDPERDEAHLSEDRPDRRPGPRKAPRALPPRPRAGLALT